MTLHLSGSERYWTIDEELSAIFLHPTLRGLTISCAELHQDALRWLRGTVRTPLRKLELIECNLTVEALDILLSIPRALEELTIGKAPPVPLSKITSPNLLISAEQARTASTLGTTPPSSPDQAIDTPIASAAPTQPPSSRP